jgi:hypothetical protein
VDFKNPQVLATESHYGKRLVKEALFIKMNEKELMNGNVGKRTVNPLYYHLLGIKE